MDRKLDRKFNEAMARRDMEEVWHKADVGDAASACNCRGPSAAVVAYVHAVLA